MKINQYIYQMFLALQCCAANYQTCLLVWIIIYAHMQTNIFHWFCNCLFSLNMKIEQLFFVFVLVSRSLFLCLFCLIRRWPRYWIIRVSMPSFIFLCSRPQTVYWWTWRGSIASMTSKEWWTSSKSGKAGRSDNWKTRFRKCIRNQTHFLQPIAHWHKYSDPLLCH